MWPRGRPYQKGVHTVQESGKAAYPAFLKLTHYEVRHKMEEPTYQEEHVPDTWARQQRAVLKNGHTMLPEEFYSSTELPRSTPQIVQTCITLCRHYNVSHAPMMSALFCDSSRLTRTAHAIHLSVLGPVVVRYGGDVDNPHHQELLQPVYFYVKPRHTLVAMPCRFWTQAGHRRDLYVTKRSSKTPDNTSGTYFLDKPTGGRL